jgi:hypothetical protein
MRRYFHSSLFENHIDRGAETSLRQVVSYKGIVGTITPSSWKLMLKALGVTCLFVLCGILVAGLWPFHAPRNQVSWSGEGNGLLFGKHGTVVSANPFHASAAQGDGPCSLEIWLNPSRIESSGGMILAFYQPDSRFVPFALRQFQSGLVLERESPVPASQKAVIYVGEVFSPLKAAFVTITAGASGTSTYVDGTLVKRVPDFALSSRDLTGQFVVANHPTKAYSWSGQIKGLAIYDRELSAAEVSQSVVNWTKGTLGSTVPDSANRNGVVARYAFDEGKGSVAHNQVDSAMDLLIPRRFFVLHQQFLELPWDEFRPGWRYWKDIGVNVVGFIPLGLFFYAYFSQMWKLEKSAALTIALGFAVSLTIEVLQSFLPTRDSGTTDLITNTFGTALGVMMFRLPALQSALAAVLARAGEKSVSN